MADVWQEEALVDGDVGGVLVGGGVGGAFVGVPFPMSLMASGLATLYTKMLPGSGSALISMTVSPLLPWMPTSPVHRWCHRRGRQVLAAMIHNRHIGIPLNVGYIWIFSK